MLASYLKILDLASHDVQLGITILKENNVVSSCTQGVLEMRTNLKRERSVKNFVLFLTMLVSLMFNLWVAIFTRE